MTTQYAKNSMLCPNCRRLISRDEGACPYCGTSRPGSWWKNNRFTKGFADENRIINLIIYTNIGMYILSLLLNPRSAGLAINPFDFLSPSNRSLLILGSTGTVAIAELHRWLDPCLGKLSARQPHAYRVQPHRPAADRSPGHP
jgi:rhomboid protease GluP